MIDRITQTKITSLHESDPYFWQNFRIDPENGYKLNGRLTLLPQTNIQISSEKSDLKSNRMKENFPER